MDQIEDVLTTLASSKTDGYGPRPIPDPIDDDVRNLIDYARGSDPETRNALVSLMAERHGFVLLAFSERMASLGVRTGEARFVREGLEAAALGSHLVYYKEAVPALSLHYRTLMKLNVDPAKFFDGIAGLGGWQFDSLLKDFLKRSEQDRTIEAMGYSEGKDQDGFRYVRTW